MTTRDCDARLIAVVLLMSMNTGPCHADPKTRHLKIVAFGDSTTFGYSVQDSYPVQLARKLEDLGLDAVIINAGVNGDTTSTAKKRFERDVLDHDPNIVIIQFGLNDQTMRFYQDPRETKPYVYLAQYAENLEGFVFALRKADIRVVLMTPNPMCWTETLERHYPDGPFLAPPFGGNRLLKRYAECVRAIACTEKTPIVDVLQDFNDYPTETNSRIQRLFLEDGVHPNEQGYRRVVNRLLPALLPIVENLSVGAKRTRDKK